MQLCAYFASLCGKMTFNTASTLAQPYCTLKFKKLEYHFKIIPVSIWRLLPGSVNFVQELTCNYNMTICSLAESK